MGVTNTNFESLVKVICQSEGYDEVNILVLPSHIDSMSVEEINKLTEDTLPEIEVRLLGKRVR